MTADEKRTSYKRGLRAGFCMSGRSEADVDDQYHRSGYDQGERLWRSTSANLVFLDDPVPHNEGGHEL